MNLGIEDEFTEFKESLAQIDKGLKSVTAMLNKHGEANVYFGVSDNGDVIGMDIGKETLMIIRNRIRDRVEVPCVGNNKHVKTFKTQRIFLKAIILS